MTTDKKAWTVETWIQAAGLVAAVVAVLVTVVFSLRSERSKELTVEIVAKRPLLTVDSASPKSGLEVKLRGATVVAPWLVSIRIANTGGLSIEERDIEAPLRLFFQGAKPISAEVQSRSEPSITASVSYQEDSVTIQHKLLNPSDWVGVDVLFDGEPRLPPTALARVSGVTSPKLVGPTPSEAAKVRLSLTPLPQPVLFVALTLTTLFALGLTIGGTAVAVSSFGGLWGTSTELGRLPNSGAQQVLKTRASDLKIADTKAAIVFAALASSHEDLIQLTSEQLQTRIVDLPDGLLNSLDLDVFSASELLSVGLRTALRDALAFKLFTYLPVGVDKSASDAMKAVDVADMTAEEIREQAVGLFEAAEPKGQHKRIAKDDLFGGLLLLVGGLATIWVVGGVWRTLFG